MSLNGIWIYCLRAAVFAAAVCGLYALFCRLRGRPAGLKHLAAVAYLAALIQITVLRGGVDWQAVLTGERNALQLLPLKTTLAEARLGAWPLIYHVCGNLIWFAPLGFLLRGRKWYATLLAGAAVSAGIELMQYALMTGMTDIDDVLLNSLGALLGWRISRVLAGKKAAG